MMTYFLSLGSNINAKENLDFAGEELNKILINTKSSSIHKTKAEGFEGDDFLNSIICGETKDSFNELNNKLKSIEDACLLYTSPSPRDLSTSRMPSSA